MKYSRKQNKSACGIKTHKFADQEYWKCKKNIVLQKLSRSDNKFQGDEDTIEGDLWFEEWYEEYQCAKLIEEFPLGKGW
jgi:hypothetical protein